MSEEIGVRELAFTVSLCVFIAWNGFDDRIVGIFI